MSATALQRVVVRMLFDPGFCRAVYANPTQALHDLDLTPQERQWLVTPDPRAYQVDIYRCSRALSGLLEEYPVAGALAVRCQQGLQRLHGFFASPYLHRCIQQRGSLAEAFGDYLGAEAFRERAEVAEMAVVELAIAQVRRAEEPPASPARPLTATTHLRLAPWVVFSPTHPATLPRYSILLECLKRSQTSLLEAVLNQQLRLPSKPQRRQAPAVWLMVVGVPGAAGPSLEIASEELGTLLSAARTGMSLGALAAIAERLGAEPQEAREMLQGFVEERLLLPIPGP